MNKFSNAEQSKVRKQLLSPSYKGNSPKALRARYQKAKEKGVSDDLIYKSVKGKPFLILKAMEAATPIAENRKKDFILGIFRQFLNDLVSSDKRIRANAIGFYRSPNMDWYLNVLGIDEDWFRGLLQSSFLVLAEEK